MGSTTTISGFNGIDFGSLLNAVMTQESRPLTALQNQQSDIKGQNQILAGLVSKLGKIQDAADTLSAADSLQILKTASTDDTAVAATAGAGTATGGYDVVVTQLARAQVVPSTSTVTSTDTVVATGGSMTFTPATGDPVVVSLSGDTTLEQLATAINDTEDSPVRAAIVRSAPNAYRLVLTAATSGLENAFTLTNGLTGGAGLTYADTDNDGTSGDDAADNSVNAADALLTVNNVAVTSPTNDVSEAIPGVTLNLRKVDPATAVRIEVTRDTTALKTKVQEFVDAYNGVLQFFDDQRSALTAGKNNVSRDPLIRGLQNALRSTFFDTYGTGTFTQLAQIGVSASSAGKLQIDGKVFDAAINASPTSAQALFAGTTGDGGGAFGAFKDLMDEYTRGGGLVATSRDRMTARASDLSRQIDTLQTRLDQRRLTLQREYTDADLAMTRLKNQQAQLSSFAG